MKPAKAFIIGLALSLSLLSGAVSAAESTNVVPTEIQTNKQSPVAEFIYLKVGETSKPFRTTGVDEPGLFFSHSGLSDVYEYKVVSQILVKDHYFTGLKPGVVTLKWTVYKPFSEPELRKIVYLVFQ